MKHYRWVIYVVVAIAVFFATFMVFRLVGVQNATQFDSLDIAALHGDSYGYANALFSSLAFAGVVLALIVQTAEYGLAAKERQENLKVQETISRQQELSALASIVDSLHALQERQRISHADRTIGRAKIAVDDLRSRVRLEAALELTGEPTGAGKTLSDLLQQAPFQGRLAAAEDAQAMVSVWESAHEVYSSHHSEDIKTREGANLALHRFLDAMEMACGTFEDSLGIGKGLYDELVEEKRAAGDIDPSNCRPMLTSFYRKCSSRLSQNLFELCEVEFSG